VPGLSKQSGKFALFHFYPLIFLQNPFSHSARSEAKSQNPSAAWILRYQAGRQAVEAG
jgi:hypothetical protein